MEVYSRVYESDKSCEDISDVVQVRNNRTDSDCSSKVHAEVQCKSNDVVQQHLVVVSLLLFKQHMVDEVVEVVAHCNHTEGNNIFRHRSERHTSHCVIYCHLHRQGASQAVRQPISIGQNFVTPNSHESEVDNLRGCVAALLNEELLFHLVDLLFAD